MLGIISALAVAIFLLMGLTIENAANQRWESKVLNSRSRKDIKIDGSVYRCYSQDSISKILKELSECKEEKEVGNYGTYFKRYNGED